MLVCRNTICRNTSYRWIPSHSRQAAHPGKRDIVDMINDGQLAPVAVRFNSKGSSVLMLILHGGRRP